MWAACTDVAPLFAATRLQDSESTFRKTQLSKVAELKLEAESKLLGLHSKVIVCAEVNEGA
jgi:hypothetical protein